MRKCAKECHLYGDQEKEKGEKKAKKTTSNCGVKYISFNLTLTVISLYLNAYVPSSLFIIIVE